MTTVDDWVTNVTSLAKSFAGKHGHTYKKTKRQLYATFEVGCYLALLRRYNQDGIPCEIRNLDHGSSFRFLTTPSGNPANFSYVVVGDDPNRVEVRQQVRVRSHIDPDIAFTPDIVVLRSQTRISAERDADYAGGKRRFFCVSARDVVAAHECKSLEPFPELLVSFLGMLIAAHEWLSTSSERPPTTSKAGHLAPTLFIGGAARPMQQRMITALCSAYPMNIIQGLHFGTWDLDSDDLQFVASENQEDSGDQFADV